VKTYKDDLAGLLEEIEAEIEAEEEQQVAAH
jgi:hypothetical protein